MGRLNNIVNVSLVDTALELQASTLFDIVVPASKIHGDIMTLWVLADDQIVTVGLDHDLVGQRSAYPDFTGGATVNGIWFAEDISHVPAGDLIITITPGGTVPTVTKVFLAVKEKD